jgi:hypothetical protein
MPAPTTALPQGRPDLASSFMEFNPEMDRRGFIASKVFPVIESAKDSSHFAKIPIEQMLQDGNDDARAPGAHYSEGEWTFDKVTFACEEHGWKEAIDDRQSRMYADYFQAEQVSAMRAMDIVLRNYEKRVAAAVFNATTWTGSALTTAVTNEWDDAANATPLVDVEAAVQRVFDNSGLRANALIVGWKTFRNLRNVAEIVDRIKYAGITDPRAGAISEAALAQAFGLDMVLVGGSVKNAAKEGQAASLSQIWSGEYAMVCRVAETIDIQEPCIGRTIHWSEDGSSIGGTMETYRDEDRRSDIVRVRMDTDELVLYPEAGHLLSNIET